MLRVLRLTHSRGGGAIALLESERTWVHGPLFDPLVLLRCRQTNALTFLGGSELTEADAKVVVATGTQRLPDDVNSGLLVAENTPQVASKRTARRVAACRHCKSHGHVVHHACSVMEQLTTANQTLRNNVRPEFILLIA